MTEVHEHAVADTAVDIAARMLGERAQRAVPLGPLTTYRVGGAAALFVRPRDVSELDEVAAACRATGLPVLVVGRGSNLLVADQGFTGVAVSLAGWQEDRDHDIVIDDLTVDAGASVALPMLARRTAASGLSGFEWAVGVPGSVGGGVRMNAGGHGSDMAASLIDVDLYDVRRGERVVLRADGLGLRFRGSDLSDDQIVLRARLALQRGDRQAGEERIDAIVRWRREHQPGGQNAGSVFVNPVPGHVTAGELIDRCGLRGMRLRTAHISDKHANFIQADEGGAAADVLALIEVVRARVADETGHLMRSEVRLVGFAGLDDQHVDLQGVSW